MVNTNIGEIPLAEYMDIKARQCGFEDYDDMKANGLSIDVSCSFSTKEN